MSGTPLEVRRVVIGSDEDGRAVVTTDDLAEPVTSPLPEGIRSTVLWVVEDSPADPAQGVPPVGETQDASAWQLGPMPPAGARWTRLEFAPGAGGRGMHRTETVDLLEVQSGEIWLLLDGGDEVHLVTGDCVVQRATTHRWQNRGTEPCVMSVLMLSTEAKD